MRLMNTVNAIDKRQKMLRYRRDVNRTKTEGNMKKLIIGGWLIAAFLAVAVNFEKTIRSQAKPFTVGQILRALSAPTGDKKALFKKIAADVQARGVDFSVTAENESLLRNEGATDELIEVIRRRSPKPKLTSNAVVAATPTQTPVPTQASKIASAPPSGKVRKSSIGIELVYVPPGNFGMGSSAEEIAEAVSFRKKYSSDAKPEDFANETPGHKVTIKEGFWIGRFEVTQAQWQAVTGDNPSKFADCGGNCPVESVSWDDVQIFLKQLNARDSQYEYRLPSEAEWEYAARAGTTTVFHFGKSLNSSQANFDGNYPYASTKNQYLEKTTAVGSYQPNRFGLYDMHGNVWEWCADIYNGNFRDLPTDGSANDSSATNSNARVLRGGAWNVSGDDLRSANRSSYTPSARFNNFGFRVAARAR